MADKAPIRDEIGEGELKVYYTGEVEDRIDNTVIEGLRKLGFKFQGMAHKWGFVHKMSFTKE